MDREGQEEALVVEPRDYWNPRLSPDGQRLAVSVVDGNEDLWIIDMMRGTLSRITFNPGADYAPLWTPDGQQVAFWSIPEGAEGGLFLQAADGTGQAERLTTSEVTQRPEAFSPDARRRGAWFQREPAP